MCQSKLPNAIRKTKILQLYKEKVRDVGKSEISSQKCIGMLIQILSLVPGTT